MLVEDIQTEDPWNTFFSDDNCHRFLLVFQSYTSLVAYRCHISMVEDLVEPKSWGHLTESSRAIGIFTKVPGLVCVIITKA